MALPLRKSLFGFAGKLPAKLYKTTRKLESSFYIENPKRGKGKSLSLLFEDHAIKEMSFLALREKNM